MFVAKNYILHCIIIFENYRYAHDIIIIMFLILPEVFERSNEMTRTTILFTLNGVESAGFVILKLSLVMNVNN